MKIDELNKKLHDLYRISQIYSKAMNRNFSCSSKQPKMAALTSHEKNIIQQKKRAMQHTSRFLNNKSLNHPKGNTNELLKYLQYYCFLYYRFLFMICGRNTIVCTLRFLFWILVNKPIEKPVWKQYKQRTLVSVNTQLYNLSKQS